MAYIIGWLIALIIMCLVYCVFALIDAWEENDFYNGYCAWYDAQDPKPPSFLELFSSTGENNKEGRN